MPYLLHYPSVIFSDNIYYEIKISDMIESPLLSIFPSSKKAKYPVYLRVHPRTSRVCWEVLVREGFRQTTFSTPHGEVASLYTRLTDSLDLHVRIMSDGKILQEIEPHRYSLSHVSTLLFPTVLPCLFEVKSIFDRHGVPYRIEYKGRECKIVSVRSYLLD